ncbi:hypothetical protein ELQ87_26340 [Streptomyces griseoviridis]|uniref:Uncharacterized protein n=1 Tax=Streptomyces griseoviridis TaxID=45398 RepID=A0A3S9ZI38_STRGD|nr:hypothetical protein ELQ87_26340 [Streptomyces griseoviridis]QCN85800.1 hypothetical protein DDJ31_12925 [Streptomyces griseoviridis]
MPDHGTSRPRQGPAFQGRPLIDLTSLFSAPEGQTRSSTAALPPPTTNPFQAPDFGEDDSFLFDDVQEPVQDGRAARSRAA